MASPKAETPVLWPPHAKSWLIGKDSDAGRDCGQEEKGMTEDETAGWHHRLNAHKFEWTPGVGNGQGGLACCDSWGHKESDTTEWLNWTELNLSVIQAPKLRVNSYSSISFAYLSNHLIFKKKKKYSFYLLLPWIYPFVSVHSASSTSNQFRLPLHWWNCCTPILSFNFSFLARSSVVISTE